MLHKIFNIIKQHRSVISYLIFGVLTTIVNYAVYFPLYNFLNCSATISNCIAWVVAVAFAYLTNKAFVFKNHDWTPGNAIPEMLRFVGCRIGSGALETVFIFVTVDTLCWNGNFMKLLISVLVIVLNYIGSKLFVFRKREEA